MRSRLVSPMPIRMPEVNGTFAAPAPAIVASRTAGTLSGEPKCEPPFCDKRSAAVSSMIPCDTDTARKMRNATALLKLHHPQLEADGEMQGDTALSEVTRKLVLPDSGLHGEANILMMPTLDAANIAHQIVKVLTDAIPVGPILIGPARPAHILTPSVTARGILNMTAVAAVEAQERAGKQQPSLFT